MDISCVCKGIRTCIICEQTKGIRKASLSMATSLISLDMCHNCGKVFVALPESPNNLLKSCSPPCTSSNNILEANCVKESLIHLSPAIKTVLSEVIKDFREVIVVRDFVSEEEEAAISDEIDRTRWAESQSGRRKQDYGPKVNFKRKKVKLGSFNGLPPFSKLLVDRMHTTLPQLLTFEPVELCNLDYIPERGSSIDPHFDDSWLWGERLVTLNLLSHTLLTFTTPSQVSPGPPPSQASPESPPSQTSPDSPSSQFRPIELHLPLPRRSLVIVSGPARHVWHHSIKRENVASRRIAVTLRELTSEFLPGGSGYEDVGRGLLETAAGYNGQPTNFRH